MEMQQLVCRTCKSTFEREKQRGRPPVVCPDCKDKAVEAAGEKKEAKAKERATGTKLVGIPTFQSIASVEEVRVGDTVYRLPTFLFSDPMSQRRFASSYEVASIDGDTLLVISTKDKSNKFKVPANKFSRKTGMEYLQNNDDVVETVEDDV